MVNGVKVDEDVPEPSLTASSKLSTEWKRKMNFILTSRPLTHSPRVLVVLPPLHFTSRPEQLHTNQHHASRSITSAPMLSHGQACLFNVPHFCNFLLVFFFFLVEVPVLSLKIGFVSGFFPSALRPESFTYQHPTHPSPSPCLLSSSVVWSLSLSAI